MAARKNSRRIGAVFEREAAAAIRQHLGIDARRAARNGVDQGDDIMGWPGVWVECKRRASAVDGWLRQAEDAARDGATPIVVHKGPREEMMVTMRMADLMALAKNVALGMTP